MIYAIWYPSGGFGHFINATLLLHAEGFERPVTDFQFGKNGNSHSLSSSLLKFLHNSQEYPTITDSSFIKKTVLIDNGIDDESKDFLKYFPDAKVIKICYDDCSWTIIAKTMIEKAMNESVDNEITIDLDKWNGVEDWEQREKYFLYLRDHPFRLMWREDTNTENILINDLLTTERILKKFSDLNIILDNSFIDFYNKWKLSNLNYLNSYYKAYNILNDLDNNNKNKEILIDDLWTQAVVNYFIWLKYNIEVPAWDYRNWFSTTNDIIKMLKNNGVKV